MQGEAVFFDAVGVDAAATNSANSAIYSRREYEAGTTTDWDDIQTPFMDINRQSTQCTPKTQEWGHTVKTQDAAQLVLDPTNRTTIQGLRTIYKATDDNIVTAFTGDVSRKNASGGTTTATFPTDQIITLTGTGAGGSAVIDTGMFAKILEKFEDNYVSGEDIFLAIPPDGKREQIEQSGGTIMSKDFVSPQGYFERGELPDIYGVHVIVVPSLTVASSADMIMYAWVRDGIVLNTWEPLKTQVAELPTQRFYTGLYISQETNAVRIDDNRVVKVLYDRTT